MLRVLCSASVPLVAVLLFAVSGCGGDIVFGDEQQRVVDGGLDDAGTPSAPDGGATPTLDAGETCVTSYPAAWPFARDVATYRAKFHDRAAADTCAACHAATNAPLIPPGAAALADPATLDKAIDQLWGAVKPGGADALLIKWHTPMSAGGLGQTPIYSTEQSARYGAIVRELGGCP